VPTSPRKATQRAATRVRAPNAASAAADDLGPPNGVSAAFALGWTMSQLFGPVPDKEKTRTVKHLPTLAELDRASQVETAFAQVDDLLSRLSGVRRPTQGWHTAAAANSWDDANPRSDRYRDELREVNRRILEALAVASPRLLVGYELGRALSDTCYLPTKDPTGGDLFLAQFDIHRIAQLQTWLHAVAANLPKASAVTVSKALGHWISWLQANAGVLESKWEAQAEYVIGALRAQAHPWWALLAGESDMMSSQPTLTAWIASGRSLSQSLRSLSWQVIRHFWGYLLIALLVTGVLGWLVAAHTGGATRVWSTMVTVAAGLGITGSGIRGLTQKVTTALEQSLWQAATADAQAWSVTILPALRPARVARLRRRRLVPIRNANLLARDHS
jgi:hypothetical protein